MEDEKNVLSSGQLRPRSLSATFSEGYLPALYPQSFEGRYRYDVAPLDPPYLTLVV